MLARWRPCRAARGAGSRLGGPTGASALVPPADVAIYLIMRRLAGLLLLLLLMPTAPASAAELLTPPRALELARAGEITIVDVRLPLEWLATGLPAGARGVPLQNPITGAIRPDFVTDLLAAVGGNRNTPVALICAQGVRSGIASELVERAGFTAVHDIGEGMLGDGSERGWIGRGLPTERCRTC